MHDVDPRDQRIAELEQLLAVAYETIRKLEERVKELEAKLNLNSSYSSKPPSSDPPWFRRKYSQKKEKGTKKQGAQKGHQGKSRNLMPIEQVDEVEQHRPDHCEHCGIGFDSNEQMAGEPHRHQVAELPPVVVRITEHQFFCVQCPECGETTKAPWPQEVPHSAFGPRLQAEVAYLSGRFRLSRREVSAICKDMFGAEVSVGSVQRCCKNVSEALTEPMEQAETTAKQTAVAHADETGWRQAGSRQWLWVVVTPAVTLFRIASSRGSSVIIQLLGEDYSGGLVTDRWSVYGKLKKAIRQLCWAHIKRDFQGLIDAGGASQQIGERAMRESKLLFSCWHDYLGERMTRTNFNSTIGLLKGRLKRILQNGRDKLEEEKGYGLCKNLLGAALLERRPASSVSHLI